MEKGTWNNYLSDVTIDISSYTPTELSDLILKSVGDFDLSSNYINLPFSYDIETTSTYLPDGSKFAFMYIFQFGINGDFYYGRTWKEFNDFLAIFSTTLSLNPETRRAIFYVYNYAYEFQFTRNEYRVPIVSSFSEKKRKPIYVLYQSGIEFRDAMILAGPNYSLAYVGENLLLTYPIQKLVGSLDYSKVRHQSTPLTPNELAYCRNDVLILNSFIQEKIETDGSIASIPLTNTGYVRRYIRANAFGCTEKQRNEYHALMRSLSITDDEEYAQLRRAFMGGFTYANVFHACEVIEDVHSYDIKSSYPSVIMYEYFPMSPFTYEPNITSDDQLYSYLSKYCCMFDVRFYGIHTNSLAALPLSTHKCHGEHIREFQGKVISATVLTTTLTELDWFTISQFYDWDYVQIINFRYAERGRLPYPIVRSVLDFFINKTTLDSVPGKELEYLTSKNLLNSSYGMMVTQIIRDLIYYTSQGWEKEPANQLEQINDYNNNYNRFLSYAWGVWVTAHARRNLFRAIYELGSDFIYSDTDSVKFINDHSDYFTNYNHEIDSKILLTSIEQQIPLQLFTPSSPSGSHKTPGYFENEGSYLKFKTLGPKRYLIQKPDGSLKLTNGGVNTTTALEYMQQLTTSPEAVFTIYNEGLTIPPEHSGKLTHTYIDNRISTFITDYLGNRDFVSQGSSTHLSPQPYHFDIREDYIRLISGVEEVWAN